MTKVKQLESKLEILCGELKKLIERGNVGENESKHLLYPSANNTSHAAAGTSPRV